jgi:riboflavin kinase, archaea type
MRGKVLSGTGKGAKYVELYKQEFKKILGFLPFPGTLNLYVVDIPELPNPITVKMAEYGQVDCYPLAINTHNCALIRPHKTEHTRNTIEIISPINLREALHLLDGDEIICELV